MDLHNLWWIGGGYYALAVVSALVPWVNAEVLMLSAIPQARSPVQLALLVSLVTLGQMTGKATMYWIARKAVRPQSARLQQVIDRWREPLERRPQLALGVMLLSATFGLPPFYIITLAAGTFQIAFGRFLAVGTVGRLLHFAVLAFVPQLVWRSL